MKNLRLAALHRRTLYAATGLLWASGALWMLFSQPSESPWPARLMKLHGAAAMLFLVLFGSLLNHVVSGWNSGRNRASGSLMLGLAAFLAASGWGLYYIGGESLRHATSLAHAFLGLSLAVLLAAHVILGRRTRHFRKRLPA